MTTRWLVGTLLAVAVACGGPSGPEDAISGTWAGVTNDVNFVLDLTEKQQLVSGTAQFWGPGAAAVARGTVRGRHEGSDVALDVAIVGYQPMDFVGRLSANGRQMSGSVTGSGFTGQGLTLSRQ